MKRKGGTIESPKVLESRQSTINVNGDANSACHHMTCVVPQLTETYVRTKTQVFTAAVFILAKTHNNQSVYP